MLTKAVFILKKKNCEILIQFKVTVFYLYIFILQSSVSHDPSEIILICRFDAQEAFLIIINVKNSCYCLIFLWKS